MNHDLIHLFIICQADIIPGEILSILKGYGENMSITGKWIESVNKIATGDIKYKIIFAPLVGLSYLGFILLFIVISTVADNVLNMHLIFRWKFNLFVSLPLI